MNAIEQILDFFKSLKSPEVNFFLTVLLISFAPADLKWTAVFPAGVFMGWLFSYLKTVWMETKIRQKFHAKIINLSQEEKKLLKSVKDKKEFHVDPKETSEKQTYTELRYLEDLGLLCSNKEHIAGAGWYSFHINPLIIRTYEEIIENEALEVRKLGN